MIPAALLAAIPSIMQGIQGISQAQAGKRGLAGLERPVYDIPDAAKQQLAISEAAYADPRMPGEARANSQIGQTLSAMLRAGRDSSNPMAGLAMAQANSNRAYNDLATSSAQYQMQDQQNLQQNLGQYAQYEDQKWQLNKFSPYADKYNEYREMVGAGQQNQFSALNGLSSVAMQMLAPTKPVDTKQILAANYDAVQAQAQDSFITTVGKEVGQRTQAAVNSLGLTPQMINAIMQASKRM